MVFVLDDNDPGFPNPKLADEDGLLAIGGKLTPEWLLIAYNYGIFPWFDYRKSDILWYCPHERFVIFPSEIHISHSMRQMISRNTYEVTYNTAFSDVIKNCGTAQGRNEQEGAWLGPNIIKAYTKLHEMGYAKSVEVWKDGELVGGLYGIDTGKGFIGESMFSLAQSASKYALIDLALNMQISGYRLIDCQLETPHLRSMGGRFISYEEYIKYLR